MCAEVTVRTGTTLSTVTSVYRTLNEYVTLSRPALLLPVDRKLRSSLSSSHHVTMISSTNLTGNQFLKMKTKLQKNLGGSMDSSSTRFLFLTFIH